MLRVYLFGAPRFEQDGQPLAIPRRKAVALAAYLLVTGQPQSRDTLATMFWPEHDQSSARANLRRDLSRLKSALGGDIIQSEREQLAIAPDAQVWLDVTAFLEAQERAAAHHQSQGPECSACIAAWAEAVELAPEEFMAGFSLADCPKFDEWQFYQAETLRRALAHMLQQLIDGHIGRGNFDQAIGYARRWLVLDPLYEPAQRQLMRLYAWTGQQAAALRQYQEVRRLLDEELSVEPEEASQRLFEAIRTRRLEPPAKVVSAPPEDRYEVETLLTSGGHGQLYLGRDRLTDRSVVLKRLKPELLQHDPAFVARFKQEGDVLRQLAHPNIVQMLDLLEDEQGHTIVMEYVSGGSLRERLDEVGSLAVEEALDIALEVADALSRAHHLGVIHRDLKPANVLLADDGTPRLTDFGLARLTREDVRLTRTGTLLGSPVYMSPEALRGESLDARSDIWSFGILLYEMLAGRSPFEGQQLTPVMLSILNDPVPDIEHYRADLPPALVALLGRMLVKDQAGRLDSMRRVAAELEAIRAGRSVRTPDYLTPPPQRPKPASGAPARPAFLTMSETEREGARPEPVVGREPELALLEQALADARQGRGRMVFIAGEGGRGKTTLMTELARLGLANHGDLLVASGACTVYTGLGDPYLPFRDAFELLCGQVEEPWSAGTITQEQATRLWTFAPQIIRLILERGSDMLDTLISQRAVAQRLEHQAEAGVVAREQLAAVVARRAVRGGSMEASQLFEQVADVLQALTAQRPLLLLIDDLQWVDGASAQLLFHLGLRMSGSRLLIVGAYRPSEVAVSRDGQSVHPLKPVLTELQRRFGDLVLDLGAASSERGRAFVDALVDSEPNRLEASFRQALFQRTGGHALFTVELLRHMQEQNSLVQNEGGEWELCTDFNWSVLPARVEAVIARRFERLSVEQQALLTVASVEGETFTAQVLAEVQRLPERALLQELARVLGEQYRLVYEQGEFLVGHRYLTRYQFRHALVQQYVYDRLSQGERRLLHAEVGAALEKLYADDRDAVFMQLAHHFRQAGRTGKAIDYLVQAGHQARAKIALQEAARHYEAALAIWTKADDPQVRGAILRRLGETLWVLGRLDEALSAFQSGYEVFAELGDREQAGAVQQRIGRLYWERGERQTALTYYRQALETLADESDSIELARARSAIAQMHMLASEFTEALAWGEQALELARRIGAEDVVAHALNNLGTAYLGLGEVERGLTMLRQSLDLALALNLPHDACRAYLNQAEHLRHLTRYQEARAIYVRLIDYAHEYRIQLFVDSGKLHFAELDWLTGRWERVLAQLEMIERVSADEQASGYARLIATRLQGLLYTDLGQTATALEALQQGLPIARQSHELQTTFDHLGRLARVHAQRDQPEQTEQLLQELLDWAEQTTYLHADNSNTLLFAVRWSAQQGRTVLRSRAQDQLERAAEHYRTAEARACLAEARGVAALAGGDPEAGVPELDQAAETWEAIGRPYDRARALLNLAQAQRALGHTTTAEISLAQARAQVDLLARQLVDAERRAAFLERSELAHALAAWPEQAVTEQEATPTHQHRSGQRVQFCTAPDGVHIAYATSGQGPVLVKAANWLSHLEYDWESPVWRHWLDGLSQNHRLLRYDRRGCGLSDWEVEDFSLDAYVADLEAVVVRQGLTRFPLLALSGGGAVAISYAVRHPEQVSRLILYGAYSRGVNNRNAPAEVEQAQTSVRLIRLGWGQDNPAFRQFFTSLFLPEGSQEAMRWYNELQRVSSSAENAARISEAAAGVDVSDLLDQVQAPTLILHADEDAVVPYSEGRYLAARIPGARFVTLHSKNHILLADEPAWPRFLTEVQRFLQNDI